MKCLFQNADIEGYSFSFQPIDSKMYLLLKNGQGLVVDPCINDELLGLLQKSKISSLTVLLTHEHYDHISGVNWLRDHFNCTIWCNEMCAQRILDPRLNLSQHFATLITMHGDPTWSCVNVEPYKCFSNHTFKNQINIVWQGITISMVETPGHSLGSSCYCLDGALLFSGDSLVDGFPTVTRLPGGNKEAFNTITIPFLKQLSPKTMVFPGHGNPASIKNWNL